MPRSRARARPAPAPAAPVAAATKKLAPKKDAAVEVRKERPPAPAPALPAPDPPPPAKSAPKPKSKAGAGKKQVTKEENVVVKKVRPPAPVPAPAAAPAATAPPPAARPPPRWTSARRRSVVAMRRRGTFMSDAVWDLAAERLLLLGTKVVRLIPVRDVKLWLAHPDEYRAELESLKSYPGDVVLPVFDGAEQAGHFVLSVREKRVAGGDVLLVPDTLAPEGSGARPLVEQLARLLAVRLVPMPVEQQKETECGILSLEALARFLGVADFPRDRAGFVQWMLTQFQQRSLSRAERDDERFEAALSAAPVAPPPRQLRSRRRRNRSGSDGSGAPRLGRARVEQPPPPVAAAPPPPAVPAPTQILAPPDPPRHRRSRKRRGRSGSDGSGAPDVARARVEAPAAVARPVTVSADALIPGQPPAPPPASPSPLAEMDPAYPMDVWEAGCKVEYFEQETLTKLGRVRPKLVVLRGPRADAPVTCPIRGCDCTTRYTTEQALRQHFLRSHEMQKKSVRIWSAALWDTRMEPRALDPALTPPSVLARLAAVRRDDAARAAAVARDFWAGAGMGAPAAQMNGSQFADLDLTPPRLPDTVYRALTHKVRRRHLAVLKKFQAELLTWREPNSPYAAILEGDLPMAFSTAAELMSRARKWASTTKDREVGSLTGAMSRLDQYSKGGMPIHLSRDQLWKDFMKTLAQDARRHNVRQARPLTLEELEPVVKRLEEEAADPARPATDRARAARTAEIIAVAWPTAARIGCTTQLRLGDLQPEGSLEQFMRDGRAHATFSGGKSVLLRKQQYTVHPCVPEAFRPTWKRLLERKPSSTARGDQFYWPAPDSKSREAFGVHLREALRATKGLEDCSQYSIRRGSLQTMSESGMPESIQLEFSQHSNHNTLRRYLAWGRINRHLADECWEGAEKANRLRGSGDRLRATWAASGRQGGKPSASAPTAPFLGSH